MPAASLPSKACICSVTQSVLKKKKKKNRAKKRNDAVEWYGVYKHIRGYFIYKNSQTSLVSHSYGINKNIFPLSILLAQTDWSP